MDGNAQARAAQPWPAYEVESGSVGWRSAGGDNANVFRHAGSLSEDARELQFGHPPMTFWLTGLSGAGKSTIAFDLERLLRCEARPCVVLDGDNLRCGLNRDLGFSDRDRRENIRRAAEVARVMNDVGLVVITSFVSPLRDDRAAAREIIGDARFVEVHVSTPLQVCESRDPKGLYRKARRGELAQFTGIGAPYEPPLAPALSLDTARLPQGGAAAQLLDYLRRRDREHEDGQRG
ncbi:adenylyl-sulfate kinase [Trinickia soli]|uniref:Adenylyl-sulfate kinase n=1 Tax=Trinickia soli TaxID=380675 RepID=A0A2N7VPD2_9BURK|nr:adenylyl-sulfate kinase [Trinickia soli]PMS18982.1 adenylyl-sulfate kinase [Trinickia soli]CAB3719117.1 putative adenylyl-sulfate kinase [Trinickia soli]